MIQTAEDIVRAVSQARFGDTIAIPKGTFELPYLEIPTGVSLIGAGSSKTRLRFSEFRWWKGALHLHSENASLGKQRIQGIWLDGQRNSFGGILVHNRADVEIQDIVCRNFYDFAVNVQGGPGNASEYVTIAHFDILNCGREHSKEASGNIRIHGNVASLVIRDGLVSHTGDNLVQPYSYKRSGYGIKFDRYYSGDDGYNGLVKDSKIQRVRFHSKPIGGWASNLAPNINVEFWKSEGRNVEISGCHFPSSVSLEYNAGNTRTFWVHSNYFDTQWGQALELAAPHSVVERNVFDFRKNTNVWGVAGNYNSDSQISNIAFRENDFLLGDHSPHIYRTTAPLDGFEFSRNRIFSSKQIALLEMCRPNSHGSRGIHAEGNTWQSGYVPYQFSEEAFQAPEGVFLD